MSFFADRQIYQGGNQNLKRKILVIISDYKYLYKYLVVLEFKVT